MPATQGPEDDSAVRGDGSLELREVTRTHTLRAHIMLLNGAVRPAPGRLRAPGRAGTPPKTATSRATCTAPCPRARGSPRCDARSAALPLGVVQNKNGDGGGVLCRTTNCVVRGDHVAHGALQHRGALRGLQLARSNVSPLVTGL